MLRPEVYLIDGENIVMLAEGREPVPGLIHVPDVFVWSPHLIHEWADVRRVIYYTSAVGDADRRHDLTRQIRAIDYRSRDATTVRDGHVVASVFQKPKQSHKSRAVDINITIDALRYAHNGTAGTVTIVSGDSDFVPLVSELMRAGVTVLVHAFSSGLGRGVDTTADGFKFLDHAFFKPLGASSSA
ncbi:MAG: NYN domain-containing protein [Myxococcales bacterium]|nr:MAG: NYN domain-containing protein [Myxococcales bacterium]